MATAKGQLKLNQWPAFLLATAVSLPMIMVFMGWFDPQTETLTHLFNTVLGDLLVNTFILIIGVGSGVFLLGVSLAWLTTRYRFPGVSVFSWALMLPLAIPGYVMAFVILGLFDFTSPLQAFLKSLNPEWIVPEVRHPVTVILTLTLVLFPYVYMLARSAFIQQSETLLEAGRSLGLSSSECFRKISLPLARPAIIAGLSLALMETLADFGTVSIFNYDTFTTAIYKAWFGLFNISAAAQLASFLLLFVALALISEKKARGNARFYQSDLGGRDEGAKRLSGFKSLLATSYCLFILLIAFLLPVLQLGIWTFERMDAIDERYLSLILRTLTLGVSAGVIVTLLALFLVRAARAGDNGRQPAMVTIANLGYALPGSVLAVGIMLTLTLADKGLQSILSLEGQLLAGGVFGLLYAYTVRFMAAGYGPVDAAFSQITPVIVEAARSLGASRSELTRRIYWPLIRPGLLTALLLVLVDVMKEMPATLLLRPFGWDTLAVRIYELTSEGEWQLAAAPAIALVVIGLLPVYILVRQSRLKVGN